MILVLSRLALSRPGLLKRWKCLSGRAVCMFSGYNQTI